MIQEKMKGSRNILNIDTQYVPIVYQKIGCLIIKW